MERAAVAQGAPPVTPSFNCMRTEKGFTSPALWMNAGCPSRSPDEGSTVYFTLPGATPESEPSLRAGREDDA